MADLVAQNPAGGNIVAVAESAGQAQHLIIVDLLGRFEQPVHVQPLDFAAGALECERGFTVAVSAGRSQDENAWLGHER